MRKIFALACLFFLEMGVGYAQDVTLQWDATTDYGLTGYKVYYDTDGTDPYDGTGATEGNSPITITLAQDENSDPALVEYTLHNLNNTRTRFVVTALAGTLESGYSNEVDTGLCAPGNLDIVGDLSCCAGDLNNDGRVDVFDWIVFNSDWGRTDCLPVP